MKNTKFAGTLLMAGMLASAAVLAAPQGDALAQRMGAQGGSQDQTRTMEQAREREQARKQDGSGEQNRYQYRKEVREQKGFGGMGSEKMQGMGKAGGAGRR